MTLRFLADTNVLSEAVRPLPNAGVVEGLRAHTGAVALPAPAWHELWFGVGRLPPSRRRQQLEAFLQDVAARGVPVLPYDERAARWHAAERARLVAAGLTPPFVDGQIAAIARVNGLVLVTANTRDYQAFDGLELVSWRR